MIDDCDCGGDVPSAYSASFPGAPGRAVRIGAAGTVTAVAYGEAAGEGWIRFCGGSLHNSFLRASFVPRLAFGYDSCPAEPAHYEEYLLCRLTEPTGAQWLQYVLDPMPETLYLREIYAANGVLVIPDLESKLRAFCPSSVVRGQLPGTPPGQNPAHG
jgi:hypothetical protein